MKERDPLPLAEAARFVGCCTRRLRQYAWTFGIEPADDIGSFRRADLVALRVKLGMAPDPPPAIDPRSPAARGTQGKA